MLAHGSADIEFAIRFKRDIQLRMIDVSSDIMRIKTIGMDGSQRTVTIEF